MREKEEKAEGSYMCKIEKEREGERDNLLLGNINALHKYSYVNKGILSRNFV